MLPKFNRYGKYTEKLTGNKVKYLSVSFSIEHNWLVAANPTQVDSGICWAIIDRMHRPLPKTPKSFQADRFLGDVVGAVTAMV